jgi:hypothetical protein
MKIHEITDQQGEYSGVHLRIVGDGVLEIADAQGALLVPPGALEKVLERYGAPFDSEAPIAVVAELELGGGRRLRQVRHLAGYDVVPRDYLVLDRGEGEPLCCFGATVAAALQHLARAAARIS